MKKQIGTTIDKEVFKVLNERCKEMRMKRSEVIRYAIEMFLTEFSKEKIEKASRKLGGLGK